jgi:glutathione S-transferase
MQLYFSPLACSMASRITLYEADVAVDFVEVDPATKQTLAGGNYYDINPLGLVPALRTDDGEILLENAAILQYIAEQHPEASFVPATGVGRAKLRQWLSFIGTELHKALFIPLFDKGLADSARKKTLETGAKRLAYLDRHLRGREFLLDQFSVADAYLVTVLNWKIATPVDLKAWPSIEAYFARMTARPAFKRAMQEEFALYAEEQRRHKGG